MHVNICVPLQPTLRPLLPFALMGMWSLCARASDFTSEEIERLLDAGAYEEALSALDEDESLRDDLATQVRRSQRIEALLAQSEFEEALDLAIQSVEDEECPSSAADLLEVLYASGKFPECRSRGHDFLERLSLPAGSLAKARIKIRLARATLAYDRGDSEEIDRALEAANAWLEAENDEDGAFARRRVRILQQCAMLHANRGDPKSALEALETSLEVGSALSSSREDCQHPLTLRTLYWQAYLRHMLGPPREAEELANEVWEEQKKLWETPHPHLADTLFLLANIEKAKGDRVGALDYLEQAESVRDGVLPLDHANHLPGLNALSELLRAEGLVAQSLERGWRALRIANRTRAPSSQSRAWTLEGLAAALLEWSEFEEAADLFRELVELRLRQYAPDHRFVVYARSALGYCLMQLGDNRGARQSFEEVLKHDSGGEKGGQRSPAEVDERCQIMVNLAQVMAREDDLDAAFKTLERAWDEIRAVSLEVSWVSSAVLLCASELKALSAPRMNSPGETEETFKSAMDLAQEALAIRVRLFPPTDPRISWALKELGMVHAHRGDLEAAKIYLRKAVVLQRQFQGESLFLTSFETLLAQTQFRLGEHEEAFELAMGAERRGIRIFQGILTALPVRKLYDFLEVFPAGLDVALAYARRMEDPGISAEVFDLLGTLRASVFQESRERRLTAKESSEEIGLWRNKCRSINERIAALYFNPEAPDRVARYAQALLERESAERSLADAVGRHRQEASNGEFRGAQLQESLDEDQGVVSFVVYRDPTLGRRYLAFVWRASRPLALVDLGEALALEEVIGRWEDEIRRPMGGNEKDQKNWEASYQLVAQELYRKTWEPLSKHLDGCRRLDMVLDGALHRVRFAALVEPSGSFLAESGPLLVRRPSERDIANSRANASWHGKLVCLGGIEYGEGKKPSLPKLPRLTQTTQEARDVAALWTDSKLGEANLLIEKDAGETAFKEVAPSGRVIHLATHGLVLAETGSQKMEGSRGVGYAKSKAKNSSKTQEQRPRDFLLRPTSSRMDFGLEAHSRLETDPWLGGVLPLAGANEVSMDGDDGLLSAEEILHLSLDQCQLVVLSACDSDLGQIIEGEGVVGLSRAFLLAGARSVMASLWPVHDRSTQEWMRSFYREIVSGELSPAQAAQNANLTILKQRRRKGMTTHPLFWAPFVITGSHT